MTSYVSIGTNNHKTVEGHYSITPDAIFRRSRKYDSAPMPYALHITGGYFIHQGVSDGTPRSHGCIRMPGLYQKRLYEYIKKQAQKPEIIMTGLYQPTLSTLP